MGKQKDKKKSKRENKKKFVRFTDVIHYIENNFYDENFCEVFASNKARVKEALDALYDMRYNYQNAKEEIKRLNSELYELKKNTGVRNDA